MIIPVPGIILWIMLFGGLAVAAVGGLVYRFVARGKKTTALIWTGIGIALICGFGLIVGFLIE